MGREQPVMIRRSLVSVVDDDESLRDSLPDLVRELGYSAQAFSSAEAFLASDYVDQTSCLILDVTMPGMTGPDLQRELSRRRREIPIIFITLAPIRLFAPDYSTKVPWSACSSHSATRLYSRPLIRHLTRSESSALCLTVGWQSLHQSCSWQDKMPSDRRFSIAIAPSSKALLEARKREGVPTATVFP